METQTYVRIDKGFVEVVHIENEAILRIRIPPETAIDLGTKIIQAAAVAPLAAVLERLDPPTIIKFEPDYGKKEIR